MIYVVAFFIGFVMFYVMAMAIDGVVKAMRKKDKRSTPKEVCK
jgi:hypothetical protein